MATFRGFPACSCLVAWLPVYEKELLRRKVIRNNIDIAQLIGGAPQSGGTHSKGGAADIWQIQKLAVKIARQMGAAAWARTRAQDFDPHTHLVLNGCPHNSPARYQIAALAAGFNGLGLNGRGGKDDGPTPRKLRTWQQGIEWARKKQQPWRNVKLADMLKPLRAERKKAKRDGKPTRARRITAAIKRLKGK